MMMLALAAMAALPGGDPGRAHAVVEIMPPGMDNVTCFRIPSVVGPFGKDSSAVIVFAEARGHGIPARGNACDDSGRHALAMLRSPDGVHWPSSAQYLFNDTDPNKDGLNLGASLYDAQKKRVHVLFNECNDQHGTAPCGPTGQLLLMSSDDFGITWSAVRNLTSAMVGAGYVSLNPGPGSGIQLTAGAHAGRLLVPAWGPRLGHKATEDYNAVAFFSDDHGETWEWGARAPYPSAAMLPNELTAAELPDGTVLLNVRDENLDASGGQRLLSRSTDGGQT